MPAEPVATPNAPPVAGPYSPAVRAGDWLVLAGQVGLDAAAGRLADGGTEGEARQALANITTVLADCGYTAAGEPIESSEISSPPKYRDDCSYAFRPQL